MARETKTLVQCDFDGTVTHSDVSFLLLDAFANGNWRLLLEEYMSGAITVGRFNTQAFNMVGADERALLDFMRGKVQIRAGFADLLAYCQRRGFRFVIVSNGLAFYIRDILKEVGADDIEVHAAEAQFRPEGMAVKYIGPDGNALDDSFKEAYTRLFQAEGYRVVYLGNGVSDLAPAKQSQRVFATGDLVNACRRFKVKCTPFSTFGEVVKGLERLK